MTKTKNDYVRIRATPAQVRALRTWADDDQVGASGSTWIELRTPEVVAENIANGGQFAVSSVREARTLGLALKAIDDGRYAEEVRTLLSFKPSSFDF